MIFGNMLLSQERSGGREPCDALCGGKQPYLAVKISRMEARGSLSAQNPGEFVSLETY